MIGKVIRDAAGDCSYDGGHTWQRCPAAITQNNQLVTLYPSQAIIKLVNESSDTVGSISNFIVDNNPVAVNAVLRANGYSFNTNGESAIIVRSILVGTDSKSLSLLSQLKNIPYLNSNSNGTGGVYGNVNQPVDTAGGSGGTTASNIGGLVCTVGAIFGVQLCTDVSTNPTQTPAQLEAAKVAAAGKTKITITIVSIISVLLIVIIILFLKNKNKK